MRGFNIVRTFGGGILILLFTIMMLLTGCNTSQKTTEAEKKQNSAETKNQEIRTIKHEMGETEIQNTPTKIVTLELSFVDSLNAHRPVL
ncbi:hypothetical protein [Peribacillus butanolivorans]|uniref:Uncharacterized protein n=1 Tax=Peribacillus butanolivorans TaxID=421767 RepID=A0AAX0S4K2_9BACI|nr:hypothetical protein [Peribacillus butanolivorans]PEJ33216.1 hypothetical protein CN689_11805 [Peribacillus butanolivorans]QNU03284.1 hypothetical protein GM240_04545 [Peribacillus butanolivorans]